jgi:hypothetical protein
MLSVLLTVGALILGATATYFGTKRQNSGSIKTSQPDQLWDQWRSILDRLQGELDKRDAEHEADQSQIVLLTRRVGILEDVLRARGIKVPE